MNIKRKIKNSLGRIAGKFAPELSTKVLFRAHLGYPLNLNDPQTLNEKMQYLKLKSYRYDPQVTDLVDKIKVRDYVAGRIGEQYLTKLYGTWKSADEIDFNSLPEKFALKCNHGSGTNIICKDKPKLKIKETRKKLNEWLKLDFGNSRIELLYDGIDRRILCEEFIETEDGLPPKDYKLFCSNGNAKFLFVASERYEDHTKFDYFDMNWNWIPVKNGHPNAKDHPSKPKNFDEMVKVAEILSEGFPLVRVDLYNENGRIIFGEMTFLHHSGLTRFDPEDYDFLFGRQIMIDKGYNKS